MMALLYIKRETSLWSRMIACWPFKQKGQAWYPKLVSNFQTAIVMAERNNKMQRDPALLDIEFEVYNDCMRPQPSMWGQKSLFNIPCKQFNIQ